MEYRHPFTAQKQKKNIYLYETMLICAVVGDHISLFFLHSAYRHNKGIPKELETNYIVTIS